MPRALLLPGITLVRLGVCVLLALVLQFGLATGVSTTTAERTDAVRQFYLPTRVITGLGCFSRIAEVVRDYGERTLFVCGQGSLRRSGALDQAVSALQRAGIGTAVYDAVDGEPTLNMVQAAVDLARQEEVDVVIGIGGGSAMDVGKAAAALCTQEGRVQEYHRGRSLSGPGLPYVSVPTTAGTGSEVTNNAVLTDLERGVKKSMRGERLFPAAALVDPRLTVSLPPDITARSGADALCQAIESFVAIGAQPPSDGLAGEAIRLIGRSLVRAYEQGSDVYARSDMLYGSLLAGMAMTNTRLGGAHGVASPLGLGYHIPHGVVCGLLLPHVMEYSLEHGLAKYAKVARLLGVETQGLSAREAAQQAVIVVSRMMSRIGMPSHLSGFGVKREDLAGIIDQAVPSANLKNNPRPLGAEDLQIILERAL